MRYQRTTKTGRLIEFEIDEEDFEWVNQWKWHTCFFNGVEYPQRKRLSSEFWLPNNVYLARALWEHHYSKIPDGILIDHRDGNPLNNKKSNLRLATRGENSTNRNTQHSMYAGVSRWNGGNKKYSYWQAKAQVDGKQVPLKYSKSELVCALAYANYYGFDEPIIRERVKIKEKL